MFIYIYKHLFLHISHFILQFATKFNLQTLGTRHKTASFLQKVQVLVS